MGFVRKDEVYDAGSIPVWISVERKLLAGGSLSEIPATLPVTIPPAVPVELDKMGGTAKLLKTYVLAVDISAGSTSVSFAKAADWQPLTQGEFLMKAPASYATTGTGYTVGDATIDPSTGIGSFDISTGTWGTGSAGDVYVVASAAGTSKVMAVKPNGLTYADMRVKDGSYQVTTPVVVSGEILEDRIAVVPDAVKAVLPMITFNKEE